MKKNIRVKGPVYASIDFLKINILEQTIRNQKNKQTQN